MGGLHHRVDATVIGEDRVLGGEFAGSGHNEFIQEGDVLGAGHAVVAVNIIERKHMICARLEVAQGEHTLVIGAAHALQRQAGECAIIEVAVYSHDHVLHRLQVIGPQHDARHGQRVDGLACRESKGVAIELVALVVVFDSVRKVDNIGGVFLQRVTELHRHFLAHRADERLCLRGRRNDDLFLLVLEVNDLIKRDFHLVALEVERIGLR